MGVGVGVGVRGRVSPSVRVSSRVGWPAWSLMVHASPAGSEVPSSSFQFV